MNYVNISCVFKFRKKWHLWHWFLVCCFFFPDDKQEVSYLRWNSTSCNRNHYLSSVGIQMHTCTHMHQYTNIYIVYTINLGAEGSNYFASWCFFSCRWAVHRKTRQLFSYLREIHEGFCISSMLTKPRSDTRLLFWWHLLLVTVMP